MEKSITKTQREKERGIGGVGGGERALGVREHGPGAPVDRPGRLERSAISLSGRSDTIWRGSILLKAASE